MNQVPKMYCWQKKVYCHAPPVAQSNLYGLVSSFAGNSHLLEALSQKLRKQLESIKTLLIDSEEDEQQNVRCVKRALLGFIKDTLKSGIGPDSVRKVLAKMYSCDLLVDNSIYEWALREIGLLDKEASQPLEEQELPIKEEIPPLFSKDIVYHACLCSLATSTCTVANYKDFFNKRFPEHSLEEASLSRSQDREDVDRYLIARQEKVFYVAFRSEPFLSDWMKKFTSFEQGTYILMGYNTKFYKICIHRNSDTK